MRIHRFVIPTPLRTGTITVHDHHLLHQWNNVLRFKAGDTVILLDGSGKQATAKIKEMKKLVAAFTIEKVDEYESDTKETYTLYAAIIKQENFEILVQKATEVGVTTIVPLFTERSKKMSLRMDRLKRIITESVEQCGRHLVPELLEPITFEDVLKQQPKKRVGVLFDLDATNQDWMPKKGTKDISVWIGPEGGFTEEEVVQAKKSGLTIGSLGNLTLRAETAGIVALYSLICYNSIK